MDVARILYVQLVITALALCLLWQGIVIRQTGYRLEKLHREAEELTAEIEKYQAQVSKLKGPQRVVRLVEELDLNLEQPTPDAAEAVVEQEPVAQEDAEVAAE